MVNLNDLQSYWESIITRVPGIKKAFFVTEEGDLNDFISDITRHQQPFLLVIIPSAKGTGSPDAILENNLNLVYVLSKEDPQTKKTFDILKETQPVMEAIKTHLIADMDACTIMNRLDVSSMHTDPEKRLMTKATGWSLSFEFET